MANSKYNNKASATNFIRRINQIFESYTEFSIEDVVLKFHTDIEPDISYDKVKQYLQKWVSDPKWYADIRKACDGNRKRELYRSRRGVYVFRVMAPGPALKAALVPQPDDAGLFPKPTITFTGGGIVGPTGSTFLTAADLPALVRMVLNEDRTIKYIGAGRVRELIEEAIVASRRSGRIASIRQVEVLLKEALKDQNEPIEIEDKIREIMRQELDEPITTEDVREVVRNALTGTGHHFTLDNVREVAREVVNEALAAVQPTTSDFAIAAQHDLDITVPVESPVAFVDGQPMITPAGEFMIAPYPVPVTAPLLPEILGTRRNEDGDQVEYTYLLKINGRIYETYPWS